MRYMAVVSVKKGVICAVKVGWEVFPMSETETKKRVSHKCRGTLFLFKQRL